MTLANKIIASITVLIFIALSFGYSIVLILTGYSNLQVINNSYSPSILKVDQFRGRGMSDATSNLALGKIEGEEKILVLLDADWDKGSTKYFLYDPKNHKQIKYYVFYAKGRQKVFPRKKDQLVFDKTPFKKGLYFKFIFPLIINPLLWFLWSRLSKSFK